MQGVVQAESLTIVIMYPHRGERKCVIADVVIELVVVVLLVVAVCIVPGCAVVVVTDVAQEGQQYQEKLDSGYKNEKIETFFK